MKRKSRRRTLLEGEKPQMITDLEQMFGLGERTWDEGPNFKPNRIHLIGMFDIINKYVFDGKLDRNEEKRVVESTADPRYKNILAGFVHGDILGTPHRIIVVRHQSNTNFFNVTCAMIHEMIHMYDYMFGPMGAMLNDKIVVGQLDWGKPYGELDQNLENAKLRRSQLPDDMPNPNTCAKQYQFPKFKTKVAGAVYAKSGQYLDSDIPEKYRLAFNSMYDVHGPFFRQFAEKANHIGFDVQETFSAWRPHILRKTWESAEDENVPPQLLAAVKSLKSDDRIAYEYRDPKNWGIEIF